MATTTLSTERRYPPTTDAPRLARLLVEDVLAMAGMQRLEPAANLLTSEVVADAVRHGPSDIKVRVRLDPAVLRVEVSDDPGVVTGPVADMVERRTRRRIVETLAKRWGSDLDLHRTTTWFELATR